MRLRRRLTPVAASFGALLSLAVILFPLYAVVVASFQTTGELFGGAHFNWLPPNPTLQNYQTVLTAQQKHLASSLIIATSTAALTLAIALPAAHALARYRFRVTVVVVAGLLVAQIVPSIVIANSLFVVYHSLNLLNSYFGLVLADATYGVPFAILVMRAFMLGLPDEVIQAARVDGATEWQTFFRIVLPMSRSAIITVSLFGFLQGWGDFIFALTLLQGDQFAPITISMFNYVSQYSQDWGAVMAAVTLAVLPAAMMLIAGQRYIAAGLTAGSVRG